MLKKRILSVILCLCMVAGMLPVTVTVAFAESNPFDGAKYQEVKVNGQVRKVVTCVWYAWQQAYDNLGIAIPWRGNACDWLVNAQKSGYETGTEARVGAIAYWEGADWNYGWGHVAYVTAVSDGSITYNEGGSVNSRANSEGIFIGHKLPDGYGGLWPDGYIYLEPTASAQNIGNDFYAYIRNTHSGLALENHSNNVQLATVDDYDPRQIWPFRHLGYNQYKVINMYDGRCLDTDGASVRTMPYIGASKQLWQVCAAEDYSTYTLYYIAPPEYGESNVNHTKVLDVAYGNDDYVPAGRDVQLSQNWFGGSGDSFLNGGPFHKAQTFQIIKISQKDISRLMASDLGSDFYSRIEFNGTYLQTTGSGTLIENHRGINVATTKTQADDPRQIWHFMRQSDGSYKIVNEHNSWCLDIQTKTAGNNKNIWTWSDDHGGNSERWYLVHSPGDSTYRIVSALNYPSELYSIDIPNSSTAEGTNVELFSQQWGANQQFAISGISYTHPDRPTEPTNIHIQTTSNSITVTWDAVPSSSIYDNRQYEVWLEYENNETSPVEESYQIVDETSCVFDAVDAALPTGNYTVGVRSVNTLYRGYRSNDSTINLTIAPEATTYIVNVSATTGGTASGGGTCQDGASITVTATPSDGYHFVKWTEGGTQVSTDASYTFTVDKDRTLTAVFAEDEQPTPTYTVSVTASVGGSVSGGGTYDENTSATVIATPDTGYQFKGWTENGTQVSTEARYTFTVSANHTLVAVFEKETEEPPTPPTPVTYTVDVHASPSGGGTVTGSNTYQSGESVTVTATAASSYEFKGWTENGSQVSASASYTFNITTNRILTAVFEKIAIPTYSISTTASPADGGTVSGSGTYQSGTSVTVRAVANTDYQFVEWQVGGRRVSSDATYAFTISENLELDAVFEKKEENPPTPPIPTTYTISVNASPTEGGSVSGGKSCAKGESVTIKATPNNDYKFVEWRLDGSRVSTNADYTFTANASQTYTAIFEKVDTPTPPTPPTPTTYNITVNASPTVGGSVSGGDKFEENTSITVTAVPNAGYEFKGWMENGTQVSAAADYTFTVSADRTLTATFEKKAEEPPTPPAPVKYTISVSANPPAGGTVSGGNTYESGASVTVAASPSKNYRFTGWSENGQQISTNASYTFTADSDRTLVAIFSYTGGNSSSDHTPSIPTTNPGGTHSGGSTTTPSPTPSLPVSTSETTSNTTTTTASPSATTKGDTATITISSAVADEIIEQAVSNDSDQVIISPVVKGDVTKVEVTIPANVLDEVGQKTDAALLLSTPVADIAFTNNGLSNLSEYGAVTVTADTSENSIALTITAGGRGIESVRGGITLTVPIEQSASGTVAVLVHDDGTRQIIRKSVASDGSIAIPLDGPAKLEIIDNTKPFSDIPAENWAADAVAFASAHELFNGTSNNIFSPNLPMTRGMLAVVLHNLENNPGQAFSSAFSDVAGGTWYSDAVAWAAEQGIVSGYGNGLFGPGDNITREQLAVMLWRYSGEPAATNKELRFSDADSASDYALDALRWAVENGVINGYGNGILDSKGLATRAQVAQMLMNYLKK